MFSLVTILEKTSDVRERPDRATSSDEGLAQECVDRPSPREWKEVEDANAEGKNKVAPSPDGGYYRVNQNGKMTTYSCVRTHFEKFGGFLVKNNALFPEQIARFCNRSICSARIASSAHFCSSGLGTIVSLGYPGSKK